MENNNNPSDSLPESNEQKNSEVAPKFNLDDIKLVIDEKLREFLFHLEKTQHERNASILKLIEENPTKINIEKLVRDFLNYGEIDNLLDYSFVFSARTRRQLIVDNIQMEKHRLGLIEGRPNFFEFCKFVHYQYEELINFYFNHKFQNKVEEFNKLTISLHTKNSFIQAGNYTSIFNCNYSQKIAIFNEEKNISIFGNSESNRFASLRAKATKLRNDNSHRDSMTAVNEDAILKEYNSFKEQYEEVKKIIKKYRKDNSLPNSKKNEEILDELISQKSLAEEQKVIFIKCKDIEHEYYQIKFSRDEDWNEVRNSLRNLIELVKASI